VHERPEAFRLSQRACHGQPSDPGHRGPERGGRGGAALGLRGAHHPSGALQHEELGGRAPQQYRGHQRIAARAQPGPCPAHEADGAPDDPADGDDGRRRTPGKVPCHPARHPQALGRIPPRASQVAPGQQFGQPFAFVRHGPGHPGDAAAPGPAGHEKVGQPAVRHPHLFTGGRADPLQRAGDPLARAAPAGPFPLFAGLRPSGHGTPPRMAGGQ